MWLVSSLSLPNLSTLPNTSFATHPNQTTRSSTIVWGLAATGLDRVRIISPSSCPILKITPKRPKISRNAINKLTFRTNLVYTVSYAETNYTNEFVEKPSAVCPSKIQLELSNSKVVQNSKHLFTENSDYKAMSPQFKAIATSKHFYVWFVPLFASQFVIDEMAIC